MIEIVMIFALGFLAASLGALLMVPVLSKRAMRLARRRIDGLFPMSIKEITAERDALRAEFAVAQRRMERQVEDAQVKRHADMAALGTRELEVASLARDVETRDGSLAQRKAEIEQARARIADLDSNLSLLRSEHAAGLAALTTLEDAHREILVDLKAARRERDGARHDVQDVLATEDGSEALARNKEHEARTAEAAKAATALRDLRAEHDSVVADRERLRADLRASEAALAAALAGHGADTAKENADLRARIVEVADTLTRGERERLPSVGAFPATVRS